MATSFIQQMLEWWVLTVEFEASAPTPGTKSTALYEPVWEDIPRDQYPFTYLTDINQTATEIEHRQLQEETSCLTVVLFKFDDNITDQRDQLFRLYEDLKSVVRILLNNQDARGFKVVIREARVQQLPETRDTWLLVMETVFTSTDIADASFNLPALAGGP